MPMVSIIVPVYNAEKVISRCVDSILQQDYQDFELILMNDGSKDGTKEILDRYAQSDHRVRVVHKENSGVFRGAGDTFVPSLMNFCSMWLVRLSMAAMLTPRLGLKGMWISMCIELWVRGSLFLIRLIRRPPGGRQKLQPQNI